MKKLIIILLLLACFSSCSSDDETQLLKATSITIVNLDGSSLADFDCVDFTNEYAVLIIVNTNGSGSIEPTSIDFSVNGNISNITFTEIGSKLIPITLIEGENIVQLISSGSSHTVQLIAPPEFEVVF